MAPPRKDIEYALIVGLDRSNLDGCWVWRGGNPDAYGYGRLRYGPRKHYIHRLMYVLFVGPIPDDYVVDHLCRNRMCGNPLHLEPVTNATNVKRGVGRHRERTPYGSEVH